MFWDKRGRQKNVEGKEEGLIQIGKPGKVSLDNSMCEGAGHTASRMRAPKQEEGKCKGPVVDMRAVCRGVANPRPHNILQVWGGLQLLRCMRQVTFEVSEQRPNMACFMLPRDPSSSMLTEDH